MIWHTVTKFSGLQKIGWRLRVFSWRLSYRRNRWKCAVNPGGDYEGSATGYYYGQKIRKVLVGTMEMVVHIRLLRI